MFTVYGRVFLNSRNKNIDWLIDWWLQTSIAKGHFGAITNLYNFGFFICLFPLFRSCVQFLTTSSLLVIEKQECGLHNVVQPTLNSVLHLRIYKFRDLCLSVCLSVILSVCQSVSRISRKLFTQSHSRSAGMLHGSWECALSCARLLRLSSAICNLQIAYWSPGGASGPLADNILQ